MFNGVPRRTIHLYPGELRDLLGAAFGSRNEQRAVFAACEDAFSRHLGTRNALPVGAGRLGLRLILEGMGIGAGDEVIIPAFTDQSVPNAIIKAGAVPVYVDVDRRTFNMDPARLFAALTPRTRAVIALHIFGAPCDLARIKAFADANGLLLIEDCAHAIDSASAGRQCGTVGHAAIFSFVVTKAINAFGGGMVATDDDRLADFIRSRTQALPQPEPDALIRRVAVGYLLNALTRPEVFGLIGVPALKALSRSGGDAIGLYNKLVRPGTQNAHSDRAFSPVQAAVALAQLRALPNTQDERRVAAEAIVDAAPPHLHVQSVLSPADRHSWYFCVATAEDPATLVRQLLSHGVDVGRYPMRNVATLADEARGPVDFPGAQYVFEHGLQLPIHPGLGAAAERVVDALRMIGRATR